MYVCVVFLIRFAFVCVCLVLTLSRATGAVNVFVALISRTYPVKQQAGRIVCIVIVYILYSLSLNVT